MKVLVCAMFLFMVIFFILAVTGCQSTQRDGAACRQCKPVVRNYYQEYCPECSPYVATYTYPGYAIPGCSNCTPW